MMRPALTDGLAFCGSSLVVLSLGLIWFPLAPLALGGGMIALAFWLSVSEQLEKAAGKPKSEEE